MNLLDEDIDKENERVYKQGIKNSFDYIENRDEETNYSRIEEQYIELREVAKMFMPKKLFSRLINKQNRDRHYSL